MHKKSIFGPMSSLLGIMSVALLSACAQIDPHQVDVQLEETRPVAKITSYTPALSQLGRMTEIYETGTVRIQSQDIADETGTSATTGGEIQRNITEIMKSTLNSIGGSVVFIEYDPSFIQNQMVTGYSDFSQKVIPDVVITGGITEFDRALETRGEGIDVGAEYNFEKLGSDLPSKTAGFEYGDSSKAGKARITLDFNMKDFQTLAGIPKMTTTNSMEVRKGVHQKELGITLFGPTFGSKGSVKKVQGRHEAVRLLVQMSMIQMVGKYLAVPYWRLLGDDAQPDPIVTEAITTTFYQLDDLSIISSLQQWLYLHGHDVDLTGTIDQPTVQALQSFPAFDPEQGITDELFRQVYLSIPLTNQAYGRRQELNRMFAQMQAAPPEEEMQQPEPVAQQQAAPEPAPVAAQAPESAPPQQAAAYVAEEKAAVQEQPAAPASKSGFGRKLSEDEW